MNNKEEFIYLRKKIIEREFAHLNDMQFEAAMTMNGPLLILAGAGSGKTTVLINRIVNMIKYGNAYHSSSIEFADDEDIRILRDCLDNNTDPPSWIGNDCVRPYEILAITFTNKAANELKDRINRAVGTADGEVWAATFHSTCSRILRHHAQRLGYDNNFSIYDADDQKKLIKDVLKTCNIDEKTMPPKSVMTEISRAKDSLVDENEFEKTVNSDARLKMISEVYKVYARRLKEYNAMDFDDLIFNTVRLFTECPDVLEYYQERFKYIMIDEYQDTNYAQYVFARLLAQKYGNLCVVGDDDQSIYRFRGASIENILNFEKQFKNTKVIKLEQNYRSTQVILDAANSIISNNIGRKGKNLWTKKRGGEKITLYDASDERSEAKYIADTILKDIENGMRASDHAILYRMNAQSNAIENVFMRCGLPYRVVGGVKFYERREIKDVLAYMSLTDNSSNSLALLRIINEPKRGIGESTIQKMAQISHETGVSLLDVAGHADEYAVLQRPAAKLKEFAGLIDDLTEKAQQTKPHEFFEYMLEKTGYNLYLESQGDEGIDRIDNVKELASSILQYEQENEDATVSGFLEEISLVTDMDRDDAPDSDRVIMMTVHTAKGLEFPVVFLAGAEEGVFPSFRTMFSTPDEMEEERRLAYVAVTRAKNRLYITRARSRMLMGRTEYSKVSRFVQEIPRDIVDVKSDEEKFFGYSARLKPDNGYGYSDTAFKPATGSVGYSKTPSNQSASFIPAVGQTVRHKAFGVGTVVKATPMGNDTLLEIEFKNIGSKRIMANFAKLEKV